MSKNNLNLTKKEADDFFKPLQIIISSLNNCITLLNFYKEPDSKREIIINSLQNDLEVLVKLDSFIKEKLNKGD